MGGIEVAVPRRRRTVTVAKDTLKEHLARYRQIKDQRDRQEVREDDLDPSLVRAGREIGLPPGRPGFGGAVVQECAQEPVDQD